MQGERRNSRRSRRFEKGKERRFPPKPVELGKEYDVEVKEVSRRGDGVARIQGLVTFIPNAKPGDHIRVKITKIGRRFAEAEIVSSQ
ncbi:TRAM domain-containing protein [Candidatus Bathyarchaeota archaeon]|nr:TRAM domain-containing protein [Candidatus Bathyarchaeota archaeon]